MYKFCLTFSNPNVDYKDQDEWTVGVHEAILYPKYGKEQVIEFDKLWVDICNRYNVNSYPLQPWNNTTKTMIAVWERDQDIQEFVDYFFNQESIIDFFKTLETSGWTISKTSG